MPSQFADLYKEFSARTTNPEAFLETNFRPEIGWYPSKEAWRALTRTEQQIVVGLFLGLSAKEIANARETSSRTVEGHTAAIKHKLGVKKLSGYVLSTIFEKCLIEGFVTAKFIQK